MRCTACVCAAGMSGGGAAALKVLPFQVSVTSPASAREAQPKRIRAVRNQRARCMSGGVCRCKVCRFGTCRCRVGRFGVCRYRLIGANSVSAYSVGAEWIGTLLIGAELIGAELIGAELIGAELIG